MPYEFLQDRAIADAAFRARADTVEELFVAAADATMNVMVEDLSAIAPAQKKRLQVESDSIEMLLFNFLQEIIFHKDAEQLLLRVSAPRITCLDGEYILNAVARGEHINPAKHALVVDVKAVTLHRYRVEKIPGGWVAEVILDV